MKSSHEKDDLMEHLEKLDAFLSGDEPGERPIDVLRARGIEIPEEATLDDTRLHERLWAIIEEMFTIGMYVEDTDHLSDRELYRYLLTSALVEETLLPTGSGGAWVVSPIGGYSEEDIEVYLRFYADDDDRESFKADHRGPLPAKETPPFHRDHLLPKFEPSVGADLQ